MNALDAVVITAGTIESGDKARVSVLKPLDIVTTAGLPEILFRLCKLCQEHKRLAKTDVCLSVEEKPAKRKLL